MLRVSCPIFSGFSSQDGLCSIRSKRTEPPCRFLSISVLIEPGGADGSTVNAEFKDGVLKVHLPKGDKAKPKAVEVKVA